MPRTQSSDLRAVSHLSLNSCGCISHPFMCSPIIATEKSNTNGFLSQIKGRDFSRPLVGFHRKQRNRKDTQQFKTSSRNLKLQALLYPSDQMGSFEAACVSASLMNMATSLELISDKSYFSALRMFHGLRPL